MELINRDYVITQVKVKATIQSSLKQFEPIRRGTHIKQAIAKTDLFGYIYEFEEGFYPSPEEPEVNAGILFGTDSYWIGK